MVFVLYACSDEVKVENMSGFYPMNIGTTWNYESTSYITTYDSTGKFQQLSHTIEPQTTVVTKDTAVNGIVLRQFVTTIMALSGPVYEAFYYRQDIDGLKEYGYSDYGGTWTDTEIIDSTSQSKKQSFIQRFKAKATFSNNVFLYPLPLLELSYPLTVNSEWCCYPNVTNGASKHVVENDTLQIDGKAYPCFKIETIEPKEYEYYYEWISNAGLLKTESQSVMQDWVTGDKSYGQYREHIITIVKSLQLK